MKVELLDEKLPACQLGEGPHWDESTGNLSWVDIKGQRIHIYNLETQSRKEIAVSQPIGFAIPKGDYYLAGLQDGLYAVGEDGSETLLVALQPHHNIRFNDGKCDAQGRLWAGTMNMDAKPEETGRLYRFHDGVLLELDAGFAIPNGKDWSPDQSTMYHADTTRHTIWQYDFDPHGGTIGNKQSFIQFGEDVSPDGLCTDENGNLYVALFGAGEVRIFNPMGEEQDRIELPVPNITSCVLGGQNLTTLFVTTAYDGLSQEILKKVPASGQVFKISLYPAF